MTKRCLLHLRSCWPLRISERCNRRGQTLRKGISKRPYNTALPVPIVIEASVQWTVRSGWPVLFLVQREIGPPKSDQVNSRVQPSIRHVRVLAGPATRPDEVTLPHY